MITGFKKISTFPLLLAGLLIAACSGEGTVTGDGELTAAEQSQTEIAASGHGCVA